MSDKQNTPNKRKVDDLIDKISSRIGLLVDIPELIKNLFGIMTFIGVTLGIINVASKSDTASQDVAIAFNIHTTPLFLLVLWLIEVYVIYAIALVFARSYAKKDDFRLTLWWFVIDDTFRKFRVPFLSLILVPFFLISILAFMRILVLFSWPYWLISVFFLGLFVLFAPTSTIMAMVEQEKFEKRNKERLRDSMHEDWEAWDDAISRAIARNGWFARVEDLAHFAEERGIYTIIPGVFLLDEKESDVLHSAFENYIHQHRRKFLLACVIEGSSGKSIDSYRDGRQRKVLFSPSILPRTSRLYSKSTVQQL